MATWIGNLEEKWKVDKMDLSGNTRKGVMKAPRKEL
jgi:hypothetical protein